MRAPLVPPGVGTVRFSWSKTAWLYGMGIPALVVGLPALDGASAAASLVLAFLTVCCGHSVGLHRGVSHTHGEVPFAIPGACEVGRDSWTLGALSFGEGFHNSHHALPRSARMGLRPGDIDVGWWVVRGLARLGWITDVVEPYDARAARPGVADVRQVPQREAA